MQSTTGARAKASDVRADRDEIKMSRDQTRQIGAATLTVLDAPEAASLVISAIEKRSPQIFAFLNMHTLNMVDSSPELAEALNAATVFNDGIGIEFASRIIYGTSFPANLNGTDLTPLILSQLRRPAKLFLLGSAPGIAELAGAILEQTYSNVRVVGTHHGFFADNESASLADVIALAKPDLVLVGMGNPRQEVWAKNQLGRIGAVIMCVGAYLDFTAGAINRAPIIIRALRCEWIYRLALEPKRMVGRYIGGLPPFISLVARERKKVRISRVFVKND